MQFHCCYLMTLIVILFTYKREQKQHTKQFMKNSFNLDNNQYFGKSIKNI